MSKHHKKIGYVDNLVDGSMGAQTKDDGAAATLAQDHPKCGAIPCTPYRLGRALDPSTQNKPMAGIGVGGALPIGAFQS